MAVAQVDHQERLNTSFHENPRQKSHELSEKLNRDRTTIVRHLKSMGKFKN